MREDLVTPVGSRREDDVGRQLDKGLRPRLRGVLVEPVVDDAPRTRDVAVDVDGAEDDRLDVPEPGGERERLE